MATIRSSARPRRGAWNSSAGSGSEAPSGSDVMRLALAVVLASSTILQGQDIPLEYRVKAAFLFNFAKFVEWPAETAGGPLTICVAGRNVFGDALVDTVRGESINGRPLAVRVLLEPEAGCHIIFVPRGAA